MRAVRLCLIGVIVASVVVLVGGSARAGGAMWDFNGKQHYEIAFVPGDTVEASTSVWIAADDLGRPEHGPFYGYLVRPTSDGPWPPPVPDDATYLGEIALDEPYSKTHTVARLTFMVPEVEPGDYRLLHCNDPCETSLGDIMTTPITITATEGEGTLLIATRALEQRVEILEFRADRLESALKMRRKVENVNIATLRGQLATLAARVDDLQEVPESRVIEGSVGVGAALAAAGLFWVARRRRASM